MWGVKYYKNYSPRSGGAFTGGWQQCCDTIEVFSLNKVLFLSLPLTLHSHPLLPFTPKTGETNRQEQQTCGSESPGVTYLGRVKIQECRHTLAQ